MTKEEAQKLNHGLYELFWDDGGSSLAAVGSNAKGDRWFAATNWISGPCYEWENVISFRLIKRWTQSEEGIVSRSCNVYEVSDAIKERFKDEEELLPSVTVRLEDAGLIVWRFQVYSLDGSDIRGLVDLASQFGLGISVTQNAKDHGLEIKLSRKASTIQCEKQRFELLGKHAK